MMIAPDNGKDDDDDDNDDDEFETIAFEYFASLAYASKTEVPRMGKCPLRSAKKYLNMIKRTNAIKKTSRLPASLKTALKTLTWTSCSSITGFPLRIFPSTLSSTVLWKGIVALSSSGNVSPVTKHRTLAPLVPIAPTTINYK